MPAAPDPQDFILRWQASEASERSNYALFLSELCDLLDLPRPDPGNADDATNTYIIDKTVYLTNFDGSSTPNYIDLYRSGCFVLETKQGSNPVETPSSPTLPLSSFAPPTLSSFAPPTLSSFAPPTLSSFAPPTLSSFAEGGGSAFALPTPAHRRRRGTAVRGTPGWDEAMIKARNQAERYAKALPVSEGWPPFLIVVDIGHSIELFSDFSLTGKAYIPFPDSRTFRILLPQLADPEIQSRLRAVWLDPLALDPSRRTARVTREVAAKLAILARNLEQRQHPPKAVAEFLTRCIFTSFAEGVGLLPQGGWLDLLRSLREDIASFPPMVEALWNTMNHGGFSPILRKHILQFNGGLFESITALPLDVDQLNLLIEAADSNWRDVEPAIFGTLLERALDPAERHALGAHYTPRAYVERLVIPTLVEPLRDDWRNAQAVITEQVNSGNAAAAIETAAAFHRQLCATRVLDPACGSGNFLYVALEHMKRLEGEVLEALHGLGQTQYALEHVGLTVDPHQLLGIELNPRAAVIADLVLWIGYLQWHFRTRGDAQPPVPVIRNFHNIVQTDALMTWTSKSPARDAESQAITQWDGKTKKTNPTTGKQVPDESARRPVFEFKGAKKAAWPPTDFIVGNPPFIGGKDIRFELGDGYVEALRKLYDDVPDSADLVMYWWQRAAELARASKIRRFGFITTNSITQVFNRKVVAQNLNAAKNPLSLIFAIPDHPWLKALPAEESAASRPAAVRIAMTVAERGEHAGHLYTVIKEGDTSAEGTTVEVEDHLGKIFPNLKLAVDVSAAIPLHSNVGLSCRGVSLHGSGFIVTSDDASRLGLGRIPGIENHIRPYLNGRDLTGMSRNMMVIDLYGLTIDQVRHRFPEVYQWIHDRVKPQREGRVNQTVDTQTYAEKWWLFGKVRAELRDSLHGLSRYMATVETAKYRIFVFIGANTLPDNKLLGIASDDAYLLGVLSSNVHTAWALAAGGQLGPTPVYVKTRCFDPFPFPDSTEPQKQTIRDLGERLDAHRKRQQHLHPWLTLTDMYNVLEKLRATAELTEAERNIYNSGLIGILREIHDELDSAVFAAYGWPDTLNPEEVLTRIVALNAERRAEEATGLVRWLRPEYQAPTAAAVQTALGGLVDIAAPTAPTRKQPWPAAIPDQFRAVKDALRATPLQTPAQIAAAFRPASRTRIAQILETLTALGQIRRIEDRYLL